MVHADDHVLKQGKTFLFMLFIAASGADRTPQSLVTGRGRGWRDGFRMRTLADLFATAVEHHRSRQPAKARRSASISSLHSHRTAMRGICLE